HVSQDVLLNPGPHQDPLLQVIVHPGGGIDMSNLRAPLYVECEYLLDSRDPAMNSADGDIERLPERVFHAQPARPDGGMGDPCTFLGGPRDDRDAIEKPIGQGGSLWQRTWVDLRG